MKREIDRTQTGEIGTFKPGLEMFRGAQDGIIRSFPELVTSGIFINPDLVAQRWGQHAAEAYIEVVAQRVRSQSALRSAEIQRTR